MTIVNVNEDLHIRMRKAGADSRRVKSYTGSFADTLYELMHEKKISKARLAIDANLSEKTLQRMRNDDGYEPTRQTIIAICVGMKLSMTESMALIEKSPYRFRAGNYQDAVYMQILAEEGRYDIDEVNCCLRELGCDLLGSI